MAVPTVGYTFLGERIALPFGLRIERPYGVAFAADGKPVREVGSWTRIDLSLTIRPRRDAGFFGRLAGEIGSVTTITCPQLVAANDIGTLTVDGDHDAGETVVAITGASSSLPSDRIIKFASHAGVYLVLRTSTVDDVHIFPGLSADVDDGTSVRYEDNDTNLTYAGVMSDDLDALFAVREPRRTFAEAVTVLLHESRV